MSAGILPERKKPSASDPTQQPIYRATGEAPRRSMIAAMASRGPLPASELQGASNRTISTTLKHLDVLLESGWVEAQPDPRDGRRWLYRLTPAVEVRKDETGMLVRYGSCTLQF